MQAPALHRTILVVDVAGFTDPGRTMSHQMAVHEGLFEILTKALAEAGIDLSISHVEDRGDGMLILIPAEVPKTVLADQLPQRLTAALRRYNAVHAADAALQIRVGLHAGEVRMDEPGIVGSAVNFAFRILEASAAKEALAESAGPLAVIASDSFYQDVILHDPANDPHLYRAIPVQVKETTATAWLRLPDSEPRAVRHRAQTTEVDTAIPVTIYISNGAIHHRVESTVAQLLAAADLEVEYRSDPVRGGLLHG